MSYDIRGHLTCRQGPHLHMEVLKVVETVPIIKDSAGSDEIGDGRASLFLSMSCFAEL